MVILHIACINNDFCKGVCVAVPQHIIAQSKYAEVGFINVNNEQILNIENQFKYEKEKSSIENLPAPFNKPDLVIFHEVYRLAFLTILREIKEKNIPYVIVPHGCLTIEAQKNKKIKKIIGNKFLFNNFIHSSAALQCLSEQERNRIRFNVKKIISGNGTEKSIEIKNKFNEGSVSFVFIGRIDIRIKGLDILVNAISLIADFLRKKNAKFCIAGSVNGDDSKKLKQLIMKLHISDIVRIIDAVKGKEKQKLLLESDIFLLTSRTEGMPMGIIEALNYGVPCLVTKGTSVKELIESNDVGWGCETNVESLSHALKISILERNNWEQKSKNAQQLMQEQFRWENIAKKTIQIYSNLITG